MNKFKFDFEINNDLAKRKSESEKIRKTYPDKIPIICECVKSTNLKLDKHKYLVPQDLTVGQFVYVIRKRIKLLPEKALYLFVNNKLPQTNALVSEVYRNEKSDDGFLYFLAHEETSFGAFARACK